MNWRTGKPPEDGGADIFWFRPFVDERVRTTILTRYDRITERFELLDNQYICWKWDMGEWLGPLRPEDAEELERLRATVVAKEKTLCHYEEQIAEDTQRIEELESQLATALEEIAKLKSECSNHELSSEAIVEARAYLVEHLGSECECAFFDDCIHNAVALCLAAREENEQLKAEIADRKR